MNNHVESLTGLKHGLNKRSTLGQYKQAHHNPLELNLINNSQFQNTSAFAVNGQLTDITLFLMMHCWFTLSITYVINVSIHNPLNVENLSILVKDVINRMK